MNIKSGIVKSSFFDSFETSVDNKKVESLWLTEVFINFNLLK